MSQAINIAIDGYSSTGKSTLARQLAGKLGYRYIDTGAMYRGVTLYALRKGLIINGKVLQQLEFDLPRIQLEFIHNKNRGASDLYLNGENVEEAIREMMVAKAVSKVAAVSSVRKYLVEAQQKMAAQKGVVMDGRDIGTVVLPEAELKVFVTASQEIRTERRYQELKQLGKVLSKTEVEANLMERDLLDTTRKDSPLKQAKGALLLDNSGLSREEQLDLVRGWVDERLATCAE